MRRNKEGGGTDLRPTTKIISMKSLSKLITKSRGTGTQKGVMCLIRAPPWTPETVWVGGRRDSNQVEKETGGLETKLTTNLKSHTVKERGA